MPQTTENPNTGDVVEWHRSYFPSTMVRLIGPKCCADGESDERHMDSFYLLCNLAVGLCVASAAYVNRDNYVLAIDFVERDLFDRLRSLRLSTRNLRVRIQAWLAIVGGTFCALWISLAAPVLSTLVALLMAAGPWYLVRRLARERRRKIEDQLADAMVMFSGAIRAGLSIPQSIELLAVECPVPIRQEFHQISGEYKLGKPLERTLEEAKERLRSENFLLFAASLLAARSSGGRLNETVERVSSSVLELQRLERKVRAETAQARKSAVYMAIIPALLLIVYFYVDPENTPLLFTTLPGQIILSAAVLLNVIAYFWALRILDADI
jgi:tight adherence protein B